MLFLLPNQQCQSLKGTQKALLQPGILCAGCILLLIRQATPMEGGSPMLVENNIIVEIRTTFKNKTCASVKERRMLLHGITLRQQLCEISAVENLCSQTSGPQFTNIP